MIHDTILKPISIINPNLYNMSPFNRFTRKSGYASISKSLVPGMKRSKTSGRSNAGCSEPGHAEDKVIGICGGVGPAAGLMLHQIILKHTHKYCGTDQGHLDVCHISRSSDTTDRTTYLLADPSTSIENPAQGMIRTASMVTEATMSRKPNSRLVMGVPCNTFHAPPIWNEFHAEVNAVAEARNANVKVLHMLNETVSHIKSLVPSCKTVGLMSTTGTRRSRVYHDLLEAEEWNVVEVGDEVQEELHETIYNPTWGIKATTPVITPEAISAFQTFAKMLVEQGAEVIIMGCTEIPFAFVGQDRIDNALLVDPMVALGRALIRESAPEKLKRLNCTSSLGALSATEEGKKSESFASTKNDDPQ